MLGRAAGILVNRLVVGFVFAFIYQAMTGVATSALSIPLTGTIQDLIWGLESANQTQSALAIVWWVVSTILFTLIATQLVRFRRRISPYKGEKNMDMPPNITIVSLVILGATMSFLFFLVDLAIGATSTVSDIQTIYEAAVSGDYGPLAISMVFSIIAGFVVVGVIGRARKVREPHSGRRCHKHRRHPKKVLQGRRQDHSGYAGTGTGCPHTRRGEEGGQDIVLHHKVRPGRLRRGLQDVRYRRVH